VYPTSLNNFTVQACFEVSNYMYSTYLLAVTYMACKLSSPQPPPVEIHYIHWITNATNTTVEKHDRSAEEEFVLI
jgi:hypothetical protein